MKMYKVLWIDDEAEKQDAFLDDAFLEGIEITYRKTSKDGLDELKARIEQYDAVILDAMVYNESEDEKAGLIGLQNSINGIISLESRKVLPRFIFSGYIDQDEHSSAREMLASETIFIKSKDNESLFAAIKNAADQQETTQLKHKYPSVFAVCEEKYLDGDHFDRLLQMVRDVETPSQIRGAQDMLNPMRKVIEGLFTKLHELGLIPDEIKRNQGWINKSSKFLAGKDRAYEYKENIIPPMLAEGVYRLLNITQDGSHNEGTILNADSYLATSKTPYLYLSCVYLLFDILDEMKDFIDANQEVTKNEEKYQLFEVTGGASNFEGEIMQDGQGNYHCDKYILSYNYVHGKFNVGQRIRITKEGENTNPKTNQFYSRRGIWFEVID